MTGLILGSTSRHRRGLMDRLRVPFTSEPPGVDEAVIKQAMLKEGGGDPLSTVCSLAKSKALAVFERNPNAVVIGSDQAAIIDQELLDKPGNIPTAASQLRKLRGREHRLVTAVAIAHPGGLVEFHDLTRMGMRELSDAEIERYLAAEDVRDCAGSYRVEGLGVTLFDRIDTRDQTAITGLPLMQLCAELRKLGVALP